jgi:hypothetical protein
MASKVTYTGFDDIENELKKLGEMHIMVGVMEEDNSPIHIYAAANEFGAEIKPKSGKALAIPLSPEYKGKKPSEFGRGYFEFIPGKRDASGNWENAKLKKDGVEAFLLTKKTIKIPERAFLRNAMNSKKTHDKAQAFIKTYLSGILKGKKTANDLCVAVGKSLVNSIKSSITSNIAPDNAPLTKRLKTSNKTLNDSGDLRQAIGYEVVG